MFIIISFLKKVVFLVVFEIMGNVLMKKGDLENGIMNFVGVFVVMLVYCGEKNFYVMFFFIFF